MLRRPAARARVRRPARREEEVLQEWQDTSEKDLGGLRLGSLLVAEITYEGEKGQVFGSVLDRVEDELGRWVGIGVKGTSIPALRHWKLNFGSGTARLYISQAKVEKGDRIL